MASDPSSRSDVGNRTSCTVIEVMRGPFSTLYGNASGGVIAVFTEGFRSLDAVQRLLHFTSLLATLIAIGLIMSPAAHHRLAEEWAATARFMRISC